MEREKKVEGEETAEKQKENELQSRVAHLESENRRLRGEFDTQRAKFKELFLHKEGELVQKNKENDHLCVEIENCKRIVESARDLELYKQNADAEIVSLQNLLQETIEGSSTAKSVYDGEIRKLQAQVQSLQRENANLQPERQRSPQHVQEQSSLAPGLMISAVTKSLVRKLGADSFITPDSMEDSMRKVDEDDHAQEDAEVLRSLVVPLEEEIKALKDKLRAADELLQRCDQCKQGNADGQGISFYRIDGNRAQPLFSTATNTSFERQADDERSSASLPACDMCSNYEAQLVNEQQRVAELWAQVNAAEKASERHREDLLKEIGFRKEIEEKWNEKKEEHKQQVAELTTRTRCTEQDMKELHQLLSQTEKEIQKKLETLAFDRQKINLELMKLQNENDNLMGKYSVHSQQLESAMINLPNTVEELHEVVLKTHEDLIRAKICKERTEEQLNALNSDVMLLKDQINHDLEERHEMERNLLGQIEHLRTQKSKLQSEAEYHQLTLEKVRQLQHNCKDTASQLSEALKQKEELEITCNELRGRLSSLQQELHNNETLQRDFVKLTQNLQVQLEKIRTSDEQVRWQHEEDVDDCPTCKSAFTAGNRRKQHCRHCGHIFCTNCLNHTVLSGPHNRPSKVCNVCHTLLDKSSAPYFSTEAPHSPD